MPLFFVTGWLLYLDRRRKKKQIKEARKDLAQPGSDAPAWLIGFASQSGFAEQLAWQTAGQLQAAGLPVKVQPLADVSEQDLRDSSNALFVVSTFGDGEAPDSARGFERKVLGRTLSLESLNYAVLGLGDRQYQHFCGFARRLHIVAGRARRQDPVRAGGGRQRRPLRLASLAAATGPADRTDARGHLASAKL